MPRVLAAERYKEDLHETDYVACDIEDIVRKIYSIKPFDSSMFLLNVFKRRYLAN